MKRGLCCLCAVLLCTALVTAAEPTKTLPVPTVIHGTPSAQADFERAQQAETEAISQGPVQLIEVSQSAPSMVLSAKAPAGYVPQKLSFAPGSRVDCDYTGLEGEPICEDGYDDQFNVGCNADAPEDEIFSPIACGDVILGTSGTYLIDGGQTRDTDWYEIVLTEDTELTFSVVADFPVLIFMIDGRNGCEGLAILRSASAGPGTPVSLVQCLGPGTYWLWVGPSDFSGVACGSQYCASLTCEPCDLPDPLLCPEESTLLGQPAEGEDGNWALYVSNSRWGDFEEPGIKRLESFIGVGGPIHGVTWWGAAAIFNDQGRVVNCPLEPGNFTLEFYLFDDFTRRPDYATGPVATYAVTAPELTVAETGHSYKIFGEGGTIDREYIIYEWHVELPAPLALFKGWMAIQNTDYCAFWWARSMVGGTVHVLWDEEADTQEDADGDLSYCLTAPSVGPFTGACCDESIPECRNTISTDCVGVYDRWEPGQLCRDIECVDVSWACCLAGTDICVTTFIWDCPAPDSFYWGWVCDESDPRFNGQNLRDCTATPPAWPITCPSGSCYSAGLAGGFLYISWDRPTSRRTPIDNFSGCSSPITRVQWWGNTTQIWDGPDYEAPQPVPFTIRIYDQVAVPDTAQEICTYEAINTTWGYTDYAWTGSPEFGTIEGFRAILAPPCTATGTKYISIGIALDTTIDGAQTDFIWAPGANSDQTIWFYDNGEVSQPAIESGRDRSFCLYTTDLFGACCDVATGICTDNVAESTCLSSPGAQFYPDQTCASIECLPVAAACCDAVNDVCEVLTQAECDALGGTYEWLGVFSTCQADCCYVPCPMGGTPEGEPVCGDEYVDTYNYGCFMDEPVFPDDWLQIIDGQTYCAEMGTYTSGGSDLRDWDWYYYEIPAGEAKLVRAVVDAEFTADVYWLWPDPFEEGDGYCPAYVISNVGGLQCTDVTASAALPGGFYYVGVSCFGDVPCGTPYTLHIETGVAGCCVLVDDEGEFGVETSEPVCLAYGGTWNEGVDCDGGGPPCLERGDSNCDGLVNSFDIDPFVIALTQPATWQATYTCDFLCANDINCDGFVNSFDIDGFVQCLTVGCPPCP